MNTESIRVRASGLAELFDCPMKWEAKHIKGIKSPSSSAAWLCTSIHRSTAAFDKAILDGSPITADDAAGQLVDSIYHPAEEVVWEDTTQQKAEKIGLVLHARYCADIAPQHNYTGVELLFDDLEVEIPEYHITLRLTGTTDRIRQLADGRVGIVDLKSGKRAVDKNNVAITKGHGPQMGVYELLAEQYTGEPMTAPAEIIGLQTTNTARTGCGEIESPRDMLIGTEDRPGLLQMAAQIISSGNFTPNPKSMLCSEKYCPFYAQCAYHT